MKCSTPTLSNPTNATKAVEEYERKNRDNTKELQDLDPRSSLHLKERWIGGNVDLDPLSLFPPKLARIHGGIERKQAQRR